MFLPNLNTAFLETVNTFTALQVVMTLRAKIDIILNLWHYVDITRRFGNTQVALILKRCVTRTAQPLTNFLPPFIMADGNPPSARGLM